MKNKNKIKLIHNIVTNMTNLGVLKVNNNEQFNLFSSSIFFSISFSSSSCSKKKNQIKK